jgi:hypothetical protein
MPSRRLSFWLALGVTVALTPACGAENDWPLDAGDESIADQFTENEVRTKQEALDDYAPWYQTAIWCGTTPETTVSMSTNSSLSLICSATKTIVTIDNSRSRERLSFKELYIESRCRKDGRSTTVGKLRQDIGIAALGTATYTLSCPNGGSASGGRVVFREPVSAELGSGSDGPTAGNGTIEFNSTAAESWLMVPGGHLGTVLFKDANNSDWARASYHNDTSQAVQIKLSAQMMCMQDFSTLVTFDGTVEPGATKVVESGTCSTGRWLTRSALKYK